MKAQCKAGERGEFLAIGRRCRAHVCDIWWWILLTNSFSLPRFLQQRNNISPFASHHSPQPAPMECRSFPPAANNNNDEKQNENLHSSAPRSPFAFPCLSTISPHHIVRMSQHYRDPDLLISRPLKPLQYQSSMPIQPPPSLPSATSETMPTHPPIPTASPQTTPRANHSCASFGHSPAPLPLPVPIPISPFMIHRTCDLPLPSPIKSAPTPTARRRNTDKQLFSASLCPPPYRHGLAKAPDAPMNGRAAV